MHACMHAGLARLGALQLLDLSHNRLTGALPAHWDAPRLVELDLHDNALTGQLPGSLAAQPRLAYLQLQARMRALVSRPRPPHLVSRT